MLNNTTSIKS